jgi:hypothetical protein
VRGCVACVSLALWAVCGLAEAPKPGGKAKEYASAIAIEVDARDLPRKLLHTTLRIPCKPGAMRL